MGTADELDKLHRLHAAGALSDDEYARAKDRLLSTPPSAPPPPSPPAPSAPPAAASLQPNQWAMLLHVSQFAGYVIVPLAGLVVPVIIWQIKKGEDPQLDAHGKVVINWILSALIYGLVCVPLCFVLIGIPLLLALAVAAVVFPIVGCIKAGNGEVWPYPMSMTFLK